MIRFPHLNHFMDQKLILTVVGVVIPKGLLTLLMGPNGAGKSPLLSAISRLRDFQEGSVEIEGPPLPA
ncbi:ATP-binding cassette domain-containing protein [Staphylococcus hyicus]